MAERVLGVEESIFAANFKLSRFDGVFICLYLNNEYELEADRRLC